MLHHHPLSGQCAVLLLLFFAERLVFTVLVRQAAVGMQVLEPLIALVHLQAAGRM